MTIAQALSALDQRRHNGRTLEEKLRWLSQLDGTLRLLVLDRYGKGEFTPYTVDTPMDRQLLVGPPFEEIYLYWLEAQVCLADGEIAEYNNAITQYNRLYQAFGNHQNRTRIPKGEQRFRF